MPESFNKCVKSKGSKIRTKTMSKGRYQRICVDKSGKTYAGEIKTKKKM